MAATCAGENQDAWESLSVSNISPSEAEIWNVGGRTPLAPLTANGSLVIPLQE